MNDYFCVLPFFGAEYYRHGRFTPCCLLPSNANVEQIQSSMLSGKRPEECSKCWNLENKGITSDRQLKNKAFDFYSNKDISFVEQECRDNKFSKKIIKLYTSKLCNSACMTCGPDYSTKWQKLTNANIIYSTVPDHNLREISWSEVVMLSFVGGEPLYEKKNFEILERLLAANNNNCFISLVTNGSVTLTTKQIDIFQKFKNLNICFSIDGIENVFEYLRYPLKWDVVKKNLDLYLTLTKNISISYTISNLNLLYHDQTVNWFKSNNLMYNHNLVTYPTYFNVNVLPPEIKKNLPFVNPNEFNKDLFSKFIDNIRYQDNLKGIHIKNYIPELWEVINNFRKN